MSKVEIETFPRRLIAGKRCRIVFTIKVGREIRQGGGWRIQSPAITDSWKWRRWYWELETVKADCDQKGTSVRASLVLGKIRQKGIDPSKNWLREDILVTVHGRALQKGTKVIIIIGELGYSSTNQLCRVQDFATQKAYWKVAEDWRGDEDFQEIATFNTPIFPDRTVKKILVAPSVVLGEKRISLLVKPEDIYGNVSGDIKILKVPLSGKKVQRISQGEFRSNPVIREKISQKFQVFWGDLHGHCSNDPPEYGPAHGVGTPDEYYAYARDIAGLDFAALTEFNQRDHYYRQEVARRWNEDGRFVSFFGYEWGGGHGAKGHAHVIYLDDKRIPFIDRKKDAPNIQSLCKLLKKHKTDCIVIPHHTNARRDHSYKDSREKQRVVGEYMDAEKTLKFDDEGWGPWEWNSWDEELMRLFEIYQVRGSFEKDSPGEGVLLWGYKADAIHALKKGYKLGFVGGTDTHLGRPGGMERVFCLGKKRRGGLTAVLSQGLTREEIFEALRSRRCYATTGERILMDFQVDSHLMGEEIPKQKSHKFLCKVFGTDYLTEAIIFRNGKKVYSFPIRGNEMDVTFNWEDKFAEGCFYYFRVRQKNGHMAWSSPVWVTKD